MEAKSVVARLPVDSLSEIGVCSGATRGRFLSKEDLRHLLQQTPVEFFIVSVGQPVRHTSGQETFSFWKSEVQPHMVADPELPFRLEDFPGSYAYVASEWGVQAPPSIVLLEKYH